MYKISFRVNNGLFFTNQVANVLAEVIPYCKSTDITNNGYTGCM